MGNRDPQPSRLARHRFRALIASAVMTAGLSSCADTASDPVRVVGSSTIFPFAAKVAETYSERTGLPVVVEQTGSGGGHKLFCSGNPSIDATTSSRRQKPAEAAQCDQNGVGPVVEVRLGYDGIVLARAVGTDAMALDASILYHALARELPRSPTDCTPVPNPYRQWSDIDPSLPAIVIEVYGPPPTSGTRDAFVETAMEDGARRFPCLALMERDTPNTFRARVHDLREDGHWIDAGENDNALIRTLASTPDALGVFGFSFLDQNSDKVQGIPIASVAPTPDTIRNGAYPVVRDLYLYIRQGSGDAMGFALEFTSNEASGRDGYLESIGLIPLSAEERLEMRRRLIEAAQAT
ncbi:MAG: substrate-binding domain-containing protein [Pseudomonadota bacterium]